MLVLIIIYLVSIIGVGYVYSKNRFREDIVEWIIWSILPIVNTCIVIGLVWNAVEFEFTYKRKLYINWFKNLWFFRKYRIYKYNMELKNQIPVKKQHKQLLYERYGDLLDAKLYKELYYSEEELNHIKYGRKFGKTKKTMVDQQRKSKKSQS